MKHKHLKPGESTPKNQYLGIWLYPYLKIIKKYFLKHEKIVKSFYELQIEQTRITNLK